VQKETEREVKFHIDMDATGPDLGALPPGLRVIELPEARLDAQYFDSPNLDLLRRGITLRRRRDVATGDEDLWTLKLPDAAAGGVYARTEVSWPGAGHDGLHEAASLLTAVLHGEDLRAAAAFVTVRHRQEVRDETGRRLAEIDDDRVTVTAPTGKVFRQIEVELDEGDAELLDLLTKRLRRSGATPSANVPKLRQVLAERLDTATTTPAVVREGTIGALLRSRIASSVDQLVTHDIGLRLDGRSLHVHQARVACRRLRSDLKTFAAILDPAWVQATAEELRWVGNVAGAVRDLDVLDRRIAGHSSGADDPDADGFAAIAVRLATQRTAAWKELREALDSDRYLQLLKNLEAARLDPPLEAGAGDTAADAVRELVRQPWRRLRRTVEKLPAEPSDADLHRVRIRTKQLRYAAESATPVIGKAAERLARAAEQLQTELGDHHDAVVAEQALRRLVPTLKRTGAFAAGVCVAAERDMQRSLRAQWPTVWSQLDKRRLRRWLEP
jgi:CHAD domain-containing protein